MSQRDVPDFFGFHPYEFMSDERVLAMDLQQVGAYLLLMISQWINGSISADVSALAKILKQSEDDMRHIWEGVAPCFSPHPTEPGRLIQTRLEKERVHTLGVMSAERARVKAYREAKKAKILEAANRAYGVRNADVIVPSTLLSSYIKETKSENLTQWEEFRALYPRHRLDTEQAARAWISREEEAAEILAGLRAAVTSEEWARDNGRYVPKASKFIFEGMYADAAQLTQPAAVSAPASVVSTMDPETRRRLDERRRNAG